MLLTSIGTAAKIDLHSQKTSVRFETRENKGAGDSTNKGLSLFLRPKSVLTIVRRSLSMVGGELERFLCTASQASFLSHRPKYETFDGGLQPNKGVSAMPTYSTQNPPKNPGTFNSRFDLFKLHNGVKTLVCRGINLEQARGLLPESPVYRLKFTGMVKGGAA